MKSLKINKNVENNSRLELELEIGSEDMVPYYEEIISHLKKQAKIKGFRPGKAPLQLVEQKYGERADELFLKDFLPEVIRWFNQENDYQVLETPKVSIITYERKGKLVFEANYDVFPKIKTGEYRSLPIKLDTIKVEEADVKKELTAIQEKHASLKTREGKAQDGDELKLEVVVIDKADNDKVLEENKNAKLILGRNKNLPDLDKGLKKIELNETRDINVKYPKDFEDMRLRGKTLLFRCKALEINEVVLPALDDELAKDEGFGEGLGQMQESIRERLNNYGADFLARKAKKELVQKLVEQSQMDVPESLMQNEIHNILHEMGKQMQVEIHSLDHFKELMGGKDAEKSILEIKQGATASAKRLLTLIEISKLEKIQVTDEELEDRLNTIAIQLRMRPEDVKQSLLEANRIDGIKQEMLLQKTIDFVYDNAEKKKGKAIKFGEIAD